MDLPNATEWQELLQYATPAELERLARLINANRKIWTPLPGPQTAAVQTLADVIGYGGAAGGGKTDLICGLSLTEHHRIQVFRREGTELTAILDRLQDLVGHTNGYNGASRIWKFFGEKRQIEFCSAPNPGDERKYRGRPKDLLAIDEAAEFLEAQVRFIAGWVRHENPKQRLRTLLTFNPPETVEGMWIVEYFAPWLKKGHPDRAIPGELRYFTMLDGREREVPDGEPFEWRGADGKTELIIPKSRTFFPAKVQDNPYYMQSGYVSQLQALPEPLRSQLLYGDFAAGVSDDPQQVCPTEWVEAAMNRWKQPAQTPTMDSMGVDVARGGRDNTIVATRHTGNWYAKLHTFPGSTTPDGPTVAGHTVALRRNNAPVHIDAIGVGASPLDFLRQAKVQVVPVVGNESIDATDRTGLLKFSNVRSWMWWKMREELDPQNNTGIMLPPDDELKRELCAMKWTVRNRVIYMLSRDELIKLLGYSPDRATAVVLARIETPKIVEQLAEREALRRGSGVSPADRLLNELRARAGGRR